MVVLSEFVEGSSSSFKLVKRSSSSSSIGHRYDVFLSFRGLDTRHSFTDHLYKALMDATITTFLDDDDIETRDDLKPELESAIKASRASVIVLSKNYATSTWCLDELVLILEQRMTANHIVIPIFYHVEPTHVRKQQGCFGDAMAKHKQAMEKETSANKKSQWAQKINRWNKSLAEVADIKGNDVNGRLETKFIEEIVRDIYHRLHVPLRSPLPLLIGMDYSITFVTSWLRDASSYTADILTIVGMGGIGKSTLAKYVYGLHCRKFYSCSYIEDISRRCDEKFSGLLNLQKQLYGDISKTSSIQVRDVSTYTSHIENAIIRKKVLLVLDDVDSLDQLNGLLGSKGFHPGSKIIITTKDTWLTESCALFKTNIQPKHAKHLLQGLHEAGSQQLLCFHAFACNYPKAGYEEVSEKLIEYCEGHPLALEVLGKCLYNRDVAYWEGCLEGLEKEIGSRINNVLRMSFDSLPSKNVKDLFKHIACFFVGTTRDVTETILNSCEINTRIGITNLIDRCLLRLSWNNKLMMHQLLQEMGRFLVCQESPDKPWKRSRLWCHEESFKVLKQKKGKGNIIGLALDMQMLKKEKLGSLFELNTDALSNMDNLMLLQLNNLQINGSYEKFPEELRWLCMHGFPLKSICLDYPMENLVVLDMSYSYIESFDICYRNSPRPEKRQKLTGLCLKDKRLLGSLKILNLSSCKQLRSLGGFDELPALERLIVKRCNRLVQVCESIKQCTELVLIDMRYCNKLERLPRTIGILKKVKTILLDGCNLCESPIEIRNMGGINTLASSAAALEAIPSDIKFFAINLPSSLVSLSLASTNLSTESFPMDLGCLSMLKELYLDNNPIVSLPNCVRSLPRLELLSMEYCSMLTSVEHPPQTLRELILYPHRPSFLQKVVFDPEMSQLKLLIDWNLLAPSSYEFEGMVKIQPMACVEEKVLSSLGWTKLDFLNKGHLRTDLWLRGSEEFEIQMYYEFGIFSTLYGGEEIPNWLTNRSKGPSISFTILSSPKKLTGLNFCYVQTFQVPSEMFQFKSLPKIIITNVTKNCTWIYDHYIYKVDVGGECLTVLSHWMFGINEMEAGDQVTIRVASKHKQLTKECGVSLVYDDGNTDEEDVLGYYKSWNHIIGGDLIGFQLTTGEYILNNFRFLMQGDELVPFFHELVGAGASFKEEEVCFRALSATAKKVAHTWSHTQSVRIQNGKTHNYQDAKKNKEHKE